MKRLLLLTVVVLSVSSMAFAQVGMINVYADAGQASCNFVDLGALVQVFLFHEGGGATAAQFLLEVPAAWMHLGDTWNTATSIGTSISGVSLGYGACLGGVTPFNLGSVNFFGSAAAACERVSIVPDPASLTLMVELVDCVLPKPNKFTFAEGGSGTINSDGSCQCNIIPVRETTWGGIKALYN
jgi:hypothetical protein